MRRIAELCLFFVFTVTAFAQGGGSTHVDSFCLLQAVEQTMAKQNLQTISSDSKPVSTELDLHALQDKLGKLQNDPNANPKEKRFLKKQIETHSSISLDSVIQETPATRSSFKGQLPSASIADKAVFELLGISTPSNTVFMKSGSEFQEGRILKADPQHPGYWFVQEHRFVNGKMQSQTVSVLDSTFAAKAEIPSARAFVAQEWSKNYPHLLDDVIKEASSRPQTKIDQNKTQNKSGDWLDQAVQTSFTKPTLDKVTELQNQLESYRKSKNSSTTFDSHELEILGQIERERYSIQPYSMTERELLEAFIQDVKPDQIQLGSGQIKLSSQLDEMLKRQKISVSSDDSKLIQRYEEAKAKPQQNRTRLVQTEEKRLLNLNDGRTFGNVRTPRIADIRAAFPGESPALMEKIVQKSPRDNFTAEEKATMSLLLKQFAGNEKALQDPTKKFFLERFRLYRDLLHLRSSSL